MPVFFESRRDRALDYNPSLLYRTGSIGLGSPERDSCLRNFSHNHFFFPKRLTILQLAVHRKRVWTLGSSCHDVI